MIKVGLHLWRRAGSSVIVCVCLCGSGKLGVPQMDVSEVSRKAAKSTIILLLTTTSLWQMLSPGPLVYIPPSLPSPVSQTILPTPSYYCASTVMVKP